jgi:hypothetical protein
VVDDWGTWAFVIYAVMLFVLDRFLLPLPSPKRKRKSTKPVLTKEWAFGIGTLALGIDLAFLSLGQMFPWWANTCIYVAAFVIVLLCGLWCDLKWTQTGRSVAVAGGILYWVIFGVGIYKQYDHENHIDLVFQDSDLLSGWRKMVITYDLGRMKNYLASLDIPVPGKIPTIGVELGNANCSGGSFPPSKPIFRSTFKIGKDCIANRGVVTSLYIDYIVPAPSNFKSAGDLVRLIALEGAFKDYLDWSFWGGRESMSCDPQSILGLIGHADVLWRIREVFGRDFADKLVAYSLKATVADPWEGYDPDMGIYLGRKLKIGDSVEDDGTKWPKILEILKEGGVPIDKI